MSSGHELALLFLLIFAGAASGLSNNSFGTAFFSKVAVVYCGAAVFCQMTGYTKILTSS